MSLSSNSRSKPQGGYGAAPLEEEIQYLRRRVQELMKEKIALQRDLEHYKSEVTRLLSPPLIEAVVLEVLDDGRVIVKSSTGPNLIVNTVAGIDPQSLRPGMMVALNNRASTIVSVLPNRFDPIVKSMEVVEKPNVTFDDIGGLREQIREVYEAVVLPLKRPDLFRELGIEPPRGVLLYGPPGTGKTLLAKAVARESGATFIRVVASEFVNKFIGEGARLVREVFRLARRKAPSIVFIDEIDAIGARRLELGTSGDREVQRTLVQLLAEMDGFDPLGNVKVIAATNRLDLLDPALLRPGRFDRIIEIPLPDKRGRVEILRIHTRRMKLDGDVDLEMIAEITGGFSGADLKAVVVEAGYNALRRNSKVVNLTDFLKAVEKVKKRLRSSSKVGGSSLLHT
ncbi:MAG: proteasome-activating nucleotidase [Desulfurococcales archaeon]|nr:proteasome-activating nucleotidase [Desulfurococcales archaeon]